MSQYFDIIHQANIWHGMLITGLVSILGFIINYIKKERWIFVLTTIACVLTVIGIGLEMFDYIYLVEVPFLEGKTFIQAQRELEKFSLILDTKKMQNNGNGKVVDQIPKYGTIVTKNTEVEVKFKPEENEDNIKESEYILLKIGKNYFDMKEYDKAFMTYSNKNLKDNLNAKINIGYLYAHGYGVEENASKAMEIYKSIDTDEAKKNRLALLITTNKESRNFKEMDESLKYLMQKDDHDVWDYLSFSKYGRSIDEMIKENPNIKDDFEVNFEDFYKFEKDGDTQEYSNPPRNTAYYWYEFIGADYKDTDIPQTLPTYYYDRYRIKYLNFIDKIYE